MSTMLDRLKTVLENEGIKPKQLTDEFGISNSSFTDWGKGKGSPSVAFLSKFAVRFRVSIDWLVFGDEADSLNLENSNPRAVGLVNKFNSLPTEHQHKVLGFIDGMLSVMNDGQIN